MKKVFAFALATLMMLGLVACGDGGIYNEAKEAMEAQDYARVIEILDTIPDYNDSDGLRERANAILAFQDASATVDALNNELNSTIETAQALLASEKVPLDESVATDLQLSISSARESMRTIPEMPSETSDILSATEILSEPLDYGAQIEGIQTSQQSMENSIKQLEQVTNPTGDFVIERISGIETISEIQGVTEDNDPNGNLNKQGGYTSATYFSSTLIDQSSVYGNDVIDKGTEAGGCVEVYTSVEDAEKRNDYLANFDGAGILSSGSHVVLGTIVIRTSDKLTATQQNELTEQIKERLIELR